MPKTLDVVTLTTESLERLYRSMVAFSSGESGPAGATGRGAALASPPFACSPKVRPMLCSSAGQKCQTTKALKTATTTNAIAAGVAAAQRTFTNGRHGGVSHEAGGGRSSRSTAFYAPCVRQWPRKI